MASHRAGITSLKGGLESPRVSLFDAVRCLSTAMDLVSPIVAEHQRRVSYIAHRIGRELGLSGEDQSDLALAGALHDCGIFSLQERIRAKSFECDLDHPHEHGEIGCRLLKPFDLLARAAGLIRHHHVPWDSGRGREYAGREVSRLSHILHLADRVEVQLAGKRTVLRQVKRIVARIDERSGEAFAPELVEAFKSLAARESFWLDIVTGAPSPVFASQGGATSAVLSISELEQLAMIFSQLMDFRSPFTAAHTHGVAATGEALARLGGFSAGELQLMRIAGHLHDLGKFVVPIEILEKPARLTSREFSVIRTHTYYTFRILETVPDLGRVNLWGALHHERLDGRGYPFHRNKKELPEGSRMMAVADVFTAITEDRPYRKGMNRTDASKVLQEMAGERHLDPDIVSTVEANYDILEDVRREAQGSELKQYTNIRDLRVSSKSA